MQITILGMHRSGTSVLARLLNMMGAYFAPEGASTFANQENPKGFWERKDIRSLNDFVLNSQGCDWDRISNFRINELDEDTLGVFNARASRILFDMDSHRPWMIKEPRLCLLFPLWRQLLEVPVCVHVHRNPLEVAMSLKRRNNIPINYGIAFWERYNVEALNASAGLARISISYRSLMTEPLQAVTDLHEKLVTLDVQGLRLPSAKEIDAFIRLDLYRERASVENLDEYLNGHQGKLLSMLEVGNLNDEKIPLKVSKGTINALKHYDSLIVIEENYKSSEDNLIQKMDVVTTSLNSTKQEYEKQKRDALQANDELKACKATFEKALAETGKELEDCKATFTKTLAEGGEELETHKGAFRKTLAEAGKELEACKKELAGARQTIENRNEYIDKLIVPVEDLLASTSWKLGSSLASLKNRVLLKGPPPFASSQIVELISHYEHSKCQIHETQKGVCSNERDCSTDLVSIYPLVSVSRELTSVQSFDSEDFISKYPPLKKRGDRGSAVDCQLSALQEKEVTIIVPVYNAYHETKRCLDSVLAYTEIAFRLLIINDCSSDPRIARLLEKYESNDYITTSTNSKNMGYVHTVNKGISLCTGDVVLLNSDTVVTSKWLQKLLVAAYSSEKVATVTPFSNAAGAFSVPEIGKNSELPVSLSISDMGRIVARVSERSLPSVPTGNGFCMYIRREAIRDLGLFDAEKFCRGYGEENDFCMKAVKNGWLNLIDDSTFIYHKRSASFGDSKEELIQKNRKILDELHPDYSGLIQKFVQSKQIDTIRKRIGGAIDYAISKDSAPPTRILYVLHEGAGGTPQTNADLVSALTGEYEAFVLTSTLRELIVRRKCGLDFQVLASYKFEEVLKGDTFSRRDVRQLYFDILLDLDIDVLHVRHLFKHSFDLPEIASSLGIPVLLSFHDFYFVCPSVHLLDENLKYCGGFCTSGDGYCQVPAAQHKHLPRLKEYLPEWREQVSSRVLPYCDVFITTSEVSAEVYRNVYPELNERRFSVIEHGRDFPEGQHKLHSKPVRGKPIKILLPGTIDPHKGQNFVVALKAADYRELIEFHFLGGLPKELEDLGLYHGKYTRDSFHHHVAQIRPSFVGIFSIWPETYCHTLTEGIACGVPILASRIGVLEERINKLGAGWLLDFNDPGAAIEQIYRIVDTPQEYDRVLQKVDTTRFKSTTEMADEYEFEYKVASASKRKDNIGAKRVVLFTPIGSDGMAGSSYIRTILPLGHASVAEFVYSSYVNHRAYSNREIVQCLDESEIDYIIVQRTGLPAALTSSVLALCKARDIPIVYEIDDNLLAIDVSHPEFNIYFEKTTDIGRIVDSAKMVTVSTPALKQVLSSVNENIKVIPNALDEKLWFTENNKYEVNASRTITVGYMGSYTHEEDLRFLKHVIPFLQSRLLNEEGIILKFELIGGFRDAPGEKWYHRIDIPEGKGTYPDFVRWLRDVCSWDIALAPLNDTEINRSKSELKYYEYAALGAAAICSSVGGYADVIDDGKTGILMSSMNTDEWQKAIYKLAVDCAFRQLIIEQARIKITSENLLGTRPTLMKEFLEGLE